MQKICIDDPRIVFEPVARPSGHIIIDGQQRADTLKCVHGGETWPVIRGSGIQRGFCTNCFGPTCGKPQCNPCVPFLKKLDMMEKNVRY